MHQKDRVKQAWLDAGLYDSKDAKLLEFIQRLDTAPYDCWPELIDECRRNYAEYKSQIVEPILKTGDKLLRLNLLRNADFSFADEVKLTRSFIAQSNPATDSLELKTVILKGTPAMLKDVGRLKNLTPQLKSAVERARASAPAPAAKATPAASGRQESKR